MFIPNVIHFTSNVFVKEEEPKKSSKKVSKIHFREFESEKRTKKISKFQLEYGDPNFVDERTTSDKVEKKEST